MDSLIAVAETVEQLTHDVQNEINSNVAINTQQDSSIQLGATAVNNTQSNDERVLINIDQINTDITFLWKIRATVTCEYPKRTYMNTHGSGEVSNWDLTDESGSITLAAFNLNSHIMTDKIKKDQAYEFTNLSVRSASDAYKTLPHPFQLTCTNATAVKEIDSTFNHRQICYNFTHLNQVQSLPLNTIIDVHVRVLRDFGISTGMANENLWSRRDLHIDQDGVHLGMTLWNNQARLVDRNMAGLKIKMKHVKISWFDGSRVLITIGNTQLSVV